MYQPTCIPQPHNSSTTIYIIVNIHNCQTLLHSVNKAVDIQLCTIHMYICTNLCTTTPVALAHMYYDYLSLCTSGSNPLRTVSTYLCIMNNSTFNQCMYRDLHMYGKCRLWCRLITQVICKMLPLCAKMAYVAGNMLLALNVSMCPCDKGQCHMTRHLHQICVTPSENLLFNRPHSMAFIHLPITIEESNGDSKDNTYKQQFCIVWLTDC